ncbi:MAG TPA: hypothetical protein VH573_22445 [Mycobacteriales bacterium]
MGEVRPIPTLGGVVRDVRGAGRALRVSWHREDGLVVLSLWDGPRCTGTVRVDADDVPTLIEALQLGLRSPDETPAGTPEAAPDWTPDGAPDGTPGEAADRTPDGGPEAATDRTRTDGTPVDAAPADGAATDTAPADTATDRTATDRTATLGLVGDDGEDGVAG